MLNSFGISGDNMSSAVGHLWDALFAVMIVVAILGNTAVLWIVIRKSEPDGVAELQNVTNIADMSLPKREMA